ncbi:hypothetical protein [Halorussus caseinilyticus]|uniref:Uncharacterized protein n=1 Tax=Halorussus caseinilyticus TaxID=3034025 RepID=A0ABD5WMP7_9EURY|nr:hypothetical protein [Halorussus sp. DT72]
MGRRRIRGRRRTGGRRALGYASPASPAEPPAELVWTERAGESERGATRDSDALAGDATPEGVVRALGDPRPPADAVPSSDAMHSVSDSDVSLPESVESWFSNVENRAERSESPLAAPEDRPALASLARRIRRLRGEGSRPRPSSESRGPRDSRRSR